MTTESARPCSDMLLAYQSVVVHDLRGDLNGLLLTVDFLRRQLGTKPEVASLFGETLGDLDNVRGSLNRTLNQLDMVGHARRAVTQADHVEVASQNLADLASEVIRNHIAERAKRRRIMLHPPHPSNITVQADPVLLHLCVQRLLYGLTDLGRDTELTVAIEQTDQHGVIRAWFSDPSQLTDDLFARISHPPQNEPKSGAVPALSLARCLVAVMGGELRRDEPHRGGGLCMVLPVRTSQGTGSHVPPQD